MNALEVPKNGFISPEEVTKIYEKAKDMNYDHVYNREIVRFLTICKKKGYGLYSWS